MKSNSTKFGAIAAVATAAALIVAGSAAQADVALPHLISDGMVLQQKTPVHLYGRADPGERVTIAIGDRKADAVTGTDGQWSVFLKPLSAGGPYTLSIAGKNTLTVKDVLVGEVWVCSGQSNMEFNVAGASNGAETIAASADPQLRMFTVARSTQSEPQYDVAGGRWEAAGPQATPHFSAAGYFFARALRKALGVPIGMIHTSWGGTRIETWMSRKSLLATELDPKELTALSQDPAVLAPLKAAYNRQVAAWHAAGSPQGNFDDPGIAEKAKGWFAPDLDASNWKPISAPGNWESKGIDELAYLDGGVWLRKEVTLPTSWDGKAATLSLGAIDDFDRTWVNGVPVGATGNETPTWWAAPRHYTVAAGVLKPGRNVIAVRVWDVTGAGGIIGPADQMKLDPADGGAASVPLAGDWRYQIEIGRPSDPGPFSTGIDANTATALYNGMLVPVTKYTIQGALWYQGESNAWKGSRYDVRMPAMIENWRADWGIKDFPFFLVGLAPYSAGNPNDDGWAWLRETQLHATSVLPNVGMAVIDTESGMLNDVHPKKKQVVGERLALLARQIAYHERIEGTSPTYRSLSVANGTAILRFDHVGSGLEARPVQGENGVSSDGRTLVGFTIAGSDGRFVPAQQAAIRDKDTVVLSSPQVPQPVAVRFGWANYPVVNLWSKDGLPAIPFRTDAPAAK